MPARMRRTIGATIRTAGKATAHEESQAPMMPLSDPSASHVETHATMQDIMPDRRKPNAIGSSRLGMKGRILYRVQAQGRFSASLVS